MQELTNLNNYLLCEQCSMFKVEKIQRIARFFSNIRDEKTQKFADFFQSIFNENSEKISSFQDQIQIQTKEKMYKFLADYTEKDKNKIRQIVDLQSDSGAEEVDFVKKLIQTSISESSRTPKKKASCNIRQNENKRLQSENLTSSNFESNNENPIEKNIPMEYEQDSYVENSKANKKTMRQMQKLIAQAQPINDNQVSSKRNTQKKSNVETQRKPRKSIPINDLSKPKSKAKTLKAEKKTKVQVRKSLGPSQAINIDQMVKTVKIVQKNSASKNESPRRRPSMFGNLNLTLEAIAEENISTNGQEDTWAVGNWIEAKYIYGKTTTWYKAKIISIDTNLNTIKVHFYGWNSRYDTSYPLNSEDIRLIKNEDIPVPKKRRQSLINVPALPINKVSALSVEKNVNIDLESNKENINESTLEMRSKTKSKGRKKLSQKSNNHESGDSVADASESNERLLINEDEEMEYSINESHSY